MDDFLYRLYRLTRSTQRLPREDFLSLCLGRALERDSELALHLVRRLAAQSTGKPRTALLEWVADRGRTLRCRAQVPAWTNDASSAGRADLVLDLEGTSSQRLVLEAKVGDAVPTNEQLERYEDAFEGALVIPLVEERVRQECEGPCLSWDDVLLGMCTGSPSDAIADLRHDMRRLLAAAEVGDRRLCLDAGAWSRARRFVERFAALRTRLEDCLIELGPNQEVRDALRRELNDDDARYVPIEGWGIGVWLDRAIPGTRVGGVGLLVDVGDFSDEIAWKLEVRPTQEVEARLERLDTGWFPIRGRAGWFVTELHVSRGPRNLNKDDFAKTLGKGRIALRELHQYAKEAAWHTKGPGEPPYAPKLSVEDIREGVAAWDPVFDALDQAVLEILQRVASSDGDERPCQRHQDAWRTRTGRLPGSLRLRGSVPFDVGCLLIEWEQAPKGFAEAIEDAWEESDLPDPEFKDDGLELPLSEENWNTRQTVEQLAEVLQSAVEKTTRQRAARR